NQPRGGTTAPPGRAADACRRPSSGNWRSRSERVCRRWKPRGGSPPPARGRERWSPGRRRPRRERGTPLVETGREREVDALGGHGDLLDIAVAPVVEVGKDPLHEHVGRVGPGAHTDDLGLRGPAWVYRSV